MEDNRQVMVDCWAIDFHTLVSNVWQSLNWYGMKSQNRQGELSYEMKVRVPSE